MLDIDHQSIAQMPDIFMPVSPASWTSKCEHKFIVFCHPSSNRSIILFSKDICLQEPVKEDAGQLQWCVIAADGSSWRAAHQMELDPALFTSTMANEIQVFQQLSLYNLNEEDKINALALSSEFLCEHSRRWCRNMTFDRRLSLRKKGMLWKWRGSRQEECRGSTSPQV